MRHCNIAAAAGDVPPVLVGSSYCRVQGFGRNHPLAIPRVATVLRLCEELGCGFILTRALPRFTHAYAETIEMIPFVGRLAPDSTEPHPHEHIALRWMLPDEIVALDLAAADFPVLAAYRESATQP